MPDIRFKGSPDSKSKWQMIHTAQKLGLVTAISLIFQVMWTSLSQTYLTLPINNLHRSEKSRDVFSELHSPNNHSLKLPLSPHSNLNLWCHRYLSNRNSGHLWSTRIFSRNFITVNHALRWRRRAKWKENFADRSQNARSLSKLRPLE